MADQSRVETPAIRLMTAADVAEVLALERRLFPHDAWPKHFFQQELAQAEPAVPADRATRRYWVAVAGAGLHEAEETVGRSLGTEVPSSENEAHGPEAAQRPSEHRGGAGGRILGYAGMMCVLPFADVQTLAVAPEAQRTGLGSRLLRTLIQEARRRQAEQVLLEVRADNPGAQSLYRREGFAHIHTRAQYYPDGEDALIMQKLLTESQSNPAVDR